MTIQESEKLIRKYDRANKNAYRHNLFSRKFSKWNNVCHKIAPKLGFSHHCFVKPPWLYSQPETIEL